MKIFLSAGEPSGDLHAANLVEALRERLPGVEFVGFGGPKAEAAGVKLIYPLVELAVMWFGRVLLNLHKFIGLAWAADRVFRDERPDVVVLIDFPGFHWALAKRAKRRGIPVVYYVPPQLWAWAGWRVKKVRKWVDHVLCSLPFEPAWYHARGVPGAVHVGHPYFDELRERHLDGAFLAEQEARGGDLVAILPGSRTQELRKNLPTLLRAAAEVARRREGVRFALACLHERHRALASAIIAAEGLDLDGLDLFAGRTPELIRLADCAWAVSGSVSLELMTEARPTAILYKIKGYELAIARPFIKAKFITLVNLLADAELMPEYLTDRDAWPELADWAILWLSDPEAKARTAQALADLRDRVAVPGASGRAADRIAEVVRGAAAPTYRGPHATGLPAREAGAGRPAE